MMIASFDHLDGLSFENLVKGKSVLHFAPEPYISKVLKKYASRYITADLTSNKADWVLDISNMISIQSEEFDLVIAIDVLEHVMNDKKPFRKSIES